MRAPCRRWLTVRASLALVILTLVPALATADEGRGSGDTFGLGSRALPALSRVAVAGPLTTGFAAAITAGVGYSGAVLDEDDAHQRASAKLAVSYRPVSWLGVALAMDGRFDHHSGTAGSDSGWVGDPRAVVRASRQFSDSTSVGGELSLWLPGGDAPSVEFDAATVGARLLVAYQPPAKRAGVFGHLGLLIDRSARSVTGAGTLSTADRLALEVADAHAVLLGAGASYDVGQSQLFGELSWDLYIGNDAPPPLASPLRVGAGAKMPVGDRYQLWGLFEVSPGSRPEIGPMAPLFPIEPRVRLAVGIGYAIPRSRSPAHDGDHPMGQISGRVETADGAGVAGAVIEMGSRRVTTFADGTFVIESAPAGEVTVKVSGQGFRPGEATTTVTPGERATLHVVLAPDAPAGEVRGLVQSFAGAPLGATIRVAPGDKVVTAGDDGRFAVDLAPGTYTVDITEDGYRHQQRTIVVEENGVTILNVDLRKR